MVEDVIPVSNENGKPTRWDVTYSDIRVRDKKQKESFDVICVCIGYSDLPLFLDYDISI